MINLSAYMTSGAFVLQLDGTLPYQCIIFEKKPSDIASDTVHIVDLQEIGYDFSLDGEIQQYIEQYTNVLFVLDTIWLEELQDTYEETSTHLTIVNTSVGVSSFFTKLLPETTDISVDIDTPIYEPYDQESLHFFLTQTEKKYIRLSSKQLPISLFGQNMPIKQIPSLLHTTATIDTSLEATFLSGWYMLPEAVWCCNTLEIQGHVLDLFIITNYVSELSDEFLSSIRASKKLIICIDHAISPIYLRFWEKLLHDDGVQDVEIVFLTPTYEKITTALDAYVREQCDCDTQSLHRRYNEIIS